MQQTQNHNSSQATDYKQQTKVGQLQAYFKVLHAKTQKNATTSKNPLPMALINVPEFGRGKALYGLIAGC